MPAACVDSGDGAELASVDQAATAYLLGGQYYYKTDDFDEQCGASKLSVRTGPGNTAADFKNIPRGDVTYVKPFYSWNGAFPWHCGTWSPNGHDYSECDGPTADWVRVWWDPNSRRINMKCFDKCGDGSHPDDCVPY
jgi:hypothetical protein